MLTSYLGFPCSESSIYADFDTDKGTLTIPDWQLFLVHPKAGELYFAVNSDKGEPLVLEMPAAGTLTNPNIWFGAFIYEAGRWYDIYTDCYLVKTTASVTGTFEANSLSSIIPKKSDVLCR